MRSGHLHINSHYLSANVIVFINFIDRDCTHPSIYSSQYEDYIILLQRVRRTGSRGQSSHWNLLISFLYPCNYLSDRLQFVCRGSLNQAGSLHSRLSVSASKPYMLTLPWRTSSPDTLCFLWIFSHVFLINIYISLNKIKRSKRVLSFIRCVFRECCIHLISCTPLAFFK